MVGTCGNPAGTRVGRRPPLRVIAAGALILAFATYAALDAGPHALPIVLGFATADQRFINRLWRERRHEPANLRRTRVQDWVISHTQSFGMAAARQNGLRALDPHVTIISLNCTHRCMDLQRDLERLGVQPGRTAVVPAVRGLNCRRADGVECRSSYWGLLDMQQGRVKAEPTVRVECAGAGPDGKRPLEIVSTACLLERPEAMAELSTAVSHLRAVRAVYDAGVEWSLILEDDASVLTVPSWGDMGLKEVLREVPEGWSVIQLYTHLGGPLAVPIEMRSRLRGGSLVSPRILNGTHRGYWGAVAYAVSRSGARKLLDMYWPGGVDGVIDLRTSVLSDWLLFSLPGTTYTVNRPLFAHQLEAGGNGSSSIHDSHLNFHEKDRDLALRLFYPDGGIDALLG